MTTQTKQSMCVTPDGRHDWNLRGRCAICGARAGSLVNLTPHPIEGLTGNPPIPASGVVARIIQYPGWVGELETHLPDEKDRWIAIVEMSYGEITGLPEYQAVHYLNHGDSNVTTPEHYYIVSMPVAQHPAVQGRSDVLYPGDPLRDASGRMVGCTSLYRFSGFRQGES